MNEMKKTMEKTMKQTFRKLLDRGFSTDEAREITSADDELVSQVLKELGR